MARTSSGLILEVREDAVVVITPEGIYTRVPAENAPARYRRGQLIAVPLDDVWFAEEGAERDAGEAAGAPGVAASRPRSRRRRRLPARTWTWVAAAAALVVFLAAGLGAYRAYAQPAYELAVDINPGLVLQVDGDDVVTGARARNADGEALLEATDVTGDPVLEAVADLVAAAHRLGYLEGEAEAAGDLIMLSLVPHGDARGPEVAALTDALGEAARDLGVSFRAGIQVVSEDDARRARGQGVSINRWGLLRAAQVHGLDVSDPAVREAPLAALLEAVRGDLPAAAGGEQAPGPPDAPGERGSGRGPQRALEVLEFTPPGFEGTPPDGPPENLPVPVPGSEGAEAEEEHEDDSGDPPVDVDPPVDPPADPPVEPPVPVPPEGGSDD